MGTFAFVACGMGRIKEFYGKDKKNILTRLSKEYEPPSSGSQSAGEQSHETLDTVTEKLETAVVSKTKSTVSQHFENIRLIAW